jgi:hypothetical protein
MRAMLAIMSGPPRLGWARTHRRGVDLIVSI